MFRSGNDFSTLATENPWSIIGSRANGVPILVHRFVSTATFALLLLATLATFKVPNVLLPNFNQCGLQKFDLGNGRHR